MRKEKNWWKNSIIYEVYPKSFQDSNDDGIGDIPGIIARLDYLNYLGIDVIWLCPVYESPQVDNGYDISDYTKIFKPYGTMEDMEKLIHKSKNFGIEIIMDLVVNHTSNEHEWFRESKKNKSNKFRDFYIWREAVNGDVPNDLQSNFGGSAWKYDKTTDEFYLHFYSDKQPDLNWKNLKMRKEIWKIINFWIDKGISGFRMDVIDLIGKEPDKMIKENGPHLHEYLHEMYENTYGKYNLMTVGETWGASIEEGIHYSNPDCRELSMIFQFEHMQLDKISGKSRWDLKTLDLLELKEVFSKWQTGLFDKGWNSLFWNNHDLPRIVSRFGDDSTFRIESAKMLATLLYGMQGTPFIYQGEEIGMTNAHFDHLEDYVDVETQNIYKQRIAQGFSHENIINSFKKKARDNARTPMQWDSTLFSGFSNTDPWMKVNKNYQEINVENSLKDGDSIFYYYKKLIKLRKKNDVFIYGKYELMDKNNPFVYSYKRVYTHDSILVAANFTSKITTLDLVNEKAQEILISNYADSSYDLSNLTLRPYESIIFRIR